MPDATPGSPEVLAFVPTVLLAGWAMMLILGMLVYRDANARGMQGLFWFFPVAIPTIGLLFFFLYLVVRRTERRGGAESREEACNLLERWYAEGEISAAEYRALHEDLDEEEADGHSFFR
ncbi:SHOCT domain-containing protein [Methanoculleus taiwanensis]|nr:SHOCT domain-containing protein [Methanoculleus taiwanensis]